jgi:hypothetical protein
MKSKAKPAKGSARTKRFDVGGTVGALAGLGTLAYLLSRKKKGAAGAEGAEYKPQGKFPSEAGSGTSGPGMADTTTKVDDAGRQRALAASQGRPEAVEIDSSESDKALVRTDGGKTTPVVKKKTTSYQPRLTPKAQVDSSTSTSVAKSKTGQGSSTNTGVDAGIAAGQQKKQALTSKSYPSASEQAAARKDTADKLAALKKANEEKKAARDKKPGDVTFLTKERSDKAAQAMKEGRNMGLFERGYPMGKKKGGAVKSASGGSVSSASKRADGIAQRGKTRGKVC